jgi:hypothetical protein
MFICGPTLYIPTVLTPLHKAPLLPGPGKIFQLLRPSSQKQNRDWGFPEMGSVTMKISIPVLWWTPFKVFWSKFRPPGNSGSQWRGSSEPVYSPSFSCACCCLTAWRQGKIMWHTTAEITTAMCCPYLVSLRTANKNVLDLFPTTELQYYRYSCSAQCLQYT